jgi:ubiquitin carboxyl-terminal hydrolase 5/13
VQDAGISLPVPLRVKKTSEGDQVKGKAAAEGDKVQSKESAAMQGMDLGKVEYEEVDIRECLDIFTAAETLDYFCPSCQKSVNASKRTLFTTFPDVLAFNVRRFQLVNWVPQKVNVPILVPMDGLELDKYIGHGKGDDEVELPESSNEVGNKSQAITFDAGAMSQLTGMGFPEVRCQRALLATGNTGDAESAMNWLFAHMEDADIDDPIDLSAAANEPGASSLAARPDTSALEEMGFSKAQARKALRLNGNNPEMAVAWLFENGDDPGEEEVMQDEGTSSKAAGTSALGGNSNLPARYRLKAFISHKGPSVHSGHYVAHICKPESVTAHATADEDAWVLFNDEKVVRAPFTSASARDEESDVGVKGLCKLAYEYIWERQS